MSNLTAEQWEAVANGQHIIASTQSAQKLELLDEVARLRRLVRDLWQGGEALMRAGFKNDALSVKKGG